METPQRFWVWDMVTGQLVNADQLDRYVALNLDDFAEGGAACLEIREDARACFVFRNESGLFEFPLHPLSKRATISPLSWQWP